MSVFQIAHAVATAVLSALTVYLIYHPTPALRVCDSPEDSCPNYCSLRGACVSGRCRCEPGWVGHDCGAKECPRNCSGNGACLKGLCVCASRYGGEDCSLDRLEILGTGLLHGIDLNLKLGRQCAFLTRQEAERGGGNILYAGDKRKVYHVTHEMRALLPDSCPSFRWRSCAIVGNSGTLRFGSFGADIDGHDMVYRFNQAPTDGYSEHVGGKTTFESLNAKFAHSLLNDDQAWHWRDPPATFIFFEPLKLKDTYMEIRKRYPEVPAYMFSPAFAYQAHRLYDRLQENLQAAGMGCFSGEKPMSGFYAVLFAVSACDSVDLYGFDAWTDDMAGKHNLAYHYFDDDEPRPGAHSFDLTYYLYRLLELSEKYPVRLQLVDVPDDADFGLRHGGDPRNAQEDEEDLVRDIE
uniref:Alpha-N-acetyl-neuraminate alpha-2,8-sialyltransferase (Sialyltransferase 8E) n=1 Tax=Tetraselmis sp. GSL018 TaxID=582737 RepID=A0A061S3I5_9CHLO|eukprot:CAMPEP_0177600656 /NCGR_PEP_ID=MMETSP0419_2-20121207/13784_1 /TAXON_ID=582737 /ORGANISM="Tetraselmis sp., Strain GSL018" /LENGTH=407 /DNA_ID=CAMNT_0019093753 /DNA_START=1197 /DNA_END=2420 /DNA_ORIENTATION=+